jgi:hypothetical protein
MKTREQLISLPVAKALTNADGFPSPDIADSVEYLIGFLQNDSVYNYLTTWVSEHIYKEDTGVLFCYHTTLRALVLSCGNANDTILAFGDRVSGAVGSSEYKNMLGIEWEIVRDGQHTDIIISGFQWYCDAGKLPDISGTISKVYVQSKSPERFAGWMYDRINDRKQLAQSYAISSKKYTMMNMYTFIKSHNVDMRLRSDNDNSLLILRDIAAVNALADRITSDSCSDDFVHDVLALYNKPKKISKVSYALEQRDWKVFICKHIADVKCRIYTSYKV